MSKNFSKENNVGVLIWARSTPKENIFQEMISLVEQNYKKNIIFFVDDLCPQQVYNRSKETQNIEVISSQRMCNFILVVS